MSSMSCFRMMMCQMARSTAQLSESLDHAINAAVAWPRQLCSGVVSSAWSLCPSSRWLRHVENCWELLRHTQLISTDLNCTQLTLRRELRAASTTDSHVARLSRNALHGAGLRLSRTDVSSRWPIRGLATLIGCCGLNIPRMMLVLGLLGLITSLRDPQLCQLCLWPLWPMWPLWPLCLIFWSLLKLSGCMAQRMKNTPWRVRLPVLRPDRLNAWIHS